MALYREICERDLEGIVAKRKDGVYSVSGQWLKILNPHYTRGLAALRRSDWVAGFQQRIVKVSVADVRVEHQLKLADFTQWLEKPGAAV